MAVSIDSSIPRGDLRLPLPQKSATFLAVYDASALYSAALRVYTKALFCSQKALSMSHDGRTLYHFAQHGARNLERLHAELLRQEFHFREGIEVHHTFNRKRRTIYLFPWEERIVDQLLFQMLNRFFHSALSKHSYAYRYRDFGVDPCQHRIARALRNTPQPLYLIKRDVADYSLSVDHDIMLSLLEQWIDTGDYLYTLLRERVKFLVRTTLGCRLAERGVPFGSPIACLLYNIYLTPLDCEMAAIPGLNYFRYGDDILAFSASRESILEAADRLATTFARLKLRSKASYEKNMVFGAHGAAGMFTSVAKFRHLGLEFRSDGSVGLSRDKARKIRNLFRYAFRRAGRKLQILQDPQQRAQLLIEVARQVIEGGIRSIAIIDYYLKHVDDEEQVRLIDRWLAEEILARALQSGHRKRNFAEFPFKRLREMGLLSLRHRHRLLRHGSLISSFFMWRIDRLIEMESKRTEQQKRHPIEKERGRLPGPRTFSPSLEAAANTTS